MRLSRKRKTTMTIDPVKLFREDPWDGIAVSSYPSTARQLYVKDERFWVSINDRSERLFFVEEAGSFDLSIDISISGLNIDIVEVNGNTRLICWLSDSELEDKFNLVVKDIAYSCTHKKGDLLFEAVINCLEEWGDFLKPSRKGLGWKKLIGFWGELYFLNIFLSPKVGKSLSVDAWNGPDFKKQDFAVGVNAFEIKTISSGDSNVVSISSLEQLQSTVENLYLAVYRVGESIDSSGYSLEFLYSEILQSLSSDHLSKKKFIQKSMGFYSQASSTELNIKLCKVDQRFYEVKGSFPRITPDNLPVSGVVSSTYKIDLNCASEYLITEPIEV